jgi:hypothetical protein
MSGEAWQIHVDYLVYELSGVFGNIKWLKLVWTPTSDLLNLLRMLEDKFV